jgi:lipopolysaccharide transport system ATP-binding protein
VAAHLEPEILIVDEVLAVGDAEFQKKCLGKINDIARGGDRTVLVVSHNMGLITSICTNALLLSQGRLMRSGSAVDVVNDYYSAGGSSHVLNLLNAPRKIGDQFAHLLEARVESLGASSDSDFDIASPLRVVMRYHIDQKADGPLTPVFQFRTAQGQVAFVGHGTAAHSDEVGSYEVTCVVPGDLLNNDVYFIDIGLQVARLGGHYIFNEESALRINVVEKSMAPTNDNVIVSQFGGAVRPKLDWNVRRVS